MYETYFNLKERPFSIAPDPRFLYLSARHKEALGHLAYGVRNGSGFVLLTGEVGTGKTTVCRQVLQKLPENTRLAFILNPMLNAQELLASLCDELGIDYNRERYSLKDLTDNLTRFLLDCHQHNINVVLMIDEAQNLQPEVLEQIRLLTNLETDQKKLLQIILVGQPELQHLLGRQQLRQLAQRVTARYHLRPLSKEETSHYIQHRIRIANGPADLFSTSAISKVFDVSNGVPRLINNLCDRSLMAAYSEEDRQVNKRHVTAAAKEAIPTELLQQPKKDNNFSWLKTLAISVVLLSIGILLGMWITQSTDKIDTAATNQVEQLLGSETVNQSQQGAGDRIQRELLKSEQQTESSNESVDLSNKLEALATNSDAELTAANYQALARLWKIDYSQQINQPFCSFVERYGLRCFRDVISWRELITFDRPLNVELETFSGQQVWATLYKLENEQMALQIDGANISIDRRTFLAMWTREVVMLWRAPIAFDMPIGLGDRGEAVRWLGERLAFLTGQQQWKDVNEYNRLMEDAVKRFQRENGIEADGIVGMNTLVQLTSATVQGIPKLTASSN